MWTVTLDQSAAELLFLALRIFSPLLLLLRRRRLFPRSSRFSMGEDERSRRRRKKGKKRIFFFFRWWCAGGRLLYACVWAGTSKMTSVGGYCRQRDIQREKAFAGSRLGTIKKRTGYSQCVVGVCRNRRDERKQAQCRGRCRTVKSFSSPRFSLLRRLDKCKGENDGTEREITIGASARAHSGTIVFLFESWWNELALGRKRVEKKAALMLLSAEEERVTSNQNSDEDWLVDDDVTRGTSEQKKAGRRERERRRRGKNVGQKRLKEGSNSPRALKELVFEENANRGSLVQVPQPGSAINHQEQKMEKCVWHLEIILSASLSVSLSWQLLISKE